MECEQDAQNVYTWLIGPFHIKPVKCCFVPDVFVSKMVLALLKCYESVESSSEEEFAGFPEEDSTISAKIP